jgi:hypothetical protein
MGKYEGVIMPVAPEDDASWDQFIPYIQSLRDVAGRLWHAEKDAGARLFVYTRFGDLLDLLTRAKNDEDAELALICGDWMLSEVDVQAMKFTMLLLRSHHAGSIRHLVTQARMDSYVSITDAIKKHNGVRHFWDDALESAYLAFDDASLTPKIVMLVEQGVFRSADIKERLVTMQGILLPLADGAL